MCVCGNENLVREGGFKVTTKTEEENDGENSEKFEKR